MDIALEANVLRQSKETLREKAEEEGTGCPGFPGASKVDVAFSPLSLGNNPQCLCIKYCSGCFPWNGSFNPLQYPLR